MSANPFIIGIDPGGVTGLALITQFDQEAASILELAQVESMAEDGIHETGLVIRDWLETYDVTAIAIERFTISARTVKLSRQHEALEMVGVTKFLAGYFEVPVKEQSPADAKTVWPNERIRKCIDDDSLHFHDDGATFSHENRHSIDALRHALLYSKFYGKID